jgi:Ca-activated chloride channel family protein
MFRFATPFAFLLLVPWALAAWCLYRRGAPSGVLFAPTHRLPARSASGWRMLLARAAPVLFLAGTLLLVVAAARPQTYLSREHRTVDALAIEMLVDVSGSMDALDLSRQNPAGMDYKSRLDVVKETFKDFVEQRPDDLIGLVTFGGYAATRCPLTADHDTLLHVLQGVDIPRGRTDDQGRAVDQEETLTAIGDGLATGLARLSNTEPKTRIVVLLTDGDSNTGIITPDQALDAAKKTHIRVYTIGIGSTDETVPVRVKDNFGRSVIVRAQFKMDEELLTRIAAGTGGQYFNVRDHAGMKRALENIGKLETTRIARNVYRQYNEKFVWFLLAGVLLTALALTLNMQTTRRLI